MQLTQEASEDPPTSTGTLQSGAQESAPAAARSLPGQVGSLRREATAGLEK